jgi:hypothetical protein
LKETIGFLEAEPTLLPVLATFPTLVALLDLMYFLEDEIISSRDLSRDMVRMRKKLVETARYARGLKITERDQRPATCEAGSCEITKKLKLRNGCEMRQ